MGGQLLLEFIDVFTEDEFDLDIFTAVEHVIETGDARPTKRDMRRTSNFVLMRR